MEKASYWRSPALGGLELLKAHYITHHFAPHTHEGYVIGVIEDGVETFRYQGARHYAPRDHLVFINPGEVHTGSAGTEEGWRYRTLYPSVAQVQRAAQGFNNGGIPYFRQAVVYDPQLARKVRDFHQLAELEIGRLEQETAFLDILLALLHKHADLELEARGAPLDHLGIERARAFLAAYPHENTSLARLAEVADLSPYHLTRTFKRKLGLSPHAYQISERIRRAKAMLSEGIPIAQVALETGFSDQSHLGRHFKRLAGVTPGQYARGATSS